MSYIIQITDSFGISIFSLVLILIWESVWKLFALWKSARKGSITWFIVLAIFNTIGLLPMLYIFVFSNMKCKKPIKKKVKKRKAKAKK